MTQAVTLLVLIYLNLVNIKHEAAYFVFHEKVSCFE